MKEKGKVAEALSQVTTDSFKKQKQNSSRHLGTNLVLRCTDFK
jgi:hypothetical protein